MAIVGLALNLPGSSFDRSVIISHLPASFAYFGCVDYLYNLRPPGKVPHVTPQNLLCRCANIRPGIGN